MVEKLFRTVKIALGLSIFSVALRDRSWDLIYIAGFQVSQEINMSLRFLGRLSQRTSLSMLEEGAIFCTLYLGQL